MSDLFEGPAAAHDGNAGSWISRAKLAVSRVSAGWRGTAEELRLQLIRSGLEEPPHHNAWGGLIRHCAPHMLEPTGEYENMRTKRSHHRRTPVYERTATGARP